MLYYYCTNSTFLSIIKNHSFWMSDMTQSNDSFEIHNYVDIVKNAVKQRTNELEYNLRLLDASAPTKGPGCTEYENAKHHIEVFKKAFNKLASQEKIYYCLAICFTNVGDSLSQWRGYGDDGFGVSIGIDEELLKEFCSGYGLFKFGAVKYYEDADDPRIKRKIKDYLEQLDSICIDVRKNDVRSLNDALKNWATNILDNDAPFYKPAGFYEEQETRFCMVRYITSNEISNPKATSHLKNIKFHNNRSAIIPHYEMSLTYENGDYLEDIIREVIIGPCNVSKENTVMCLLTQNKFKIPRKNVKKSRIPYRSR